MRGRKKVRVMMWQVEWKRRRKKKDKVEHWASSLGLILKKKLGQALATFRLQFKFLKFKSKNNRKFGAHLYKKIGLLHT